MPSLHAFAFVLVVSLWNAAAQDPKPGRAAVPASRMPFNDWQCGATAAERILAYDSARSVCGDYMRKCHKPSENTRTVRTQKEVWPDGKIKLMPMRFNEASVVTDFAQEMQSFFWLKCRSFQTSSEPRPCCFELSVRPRRG